MVMRTSRILSVTSWILPSAAPQGQTHATPHFNKTHFSRKRHPTGPLSRNAKRDVWIRNKRVAAFKEETHVCLFVDRT